MKPDEPTNVDEPTEDNSMSRADFLANAGKSVLLVGLGAAGYASWNNLTAKIAGRKLTPLKQYPSSTWYSMAIDMTACIGCGKCVEACCEENDVPPDVFRTWVERYRVKTDGTVLIDSPNGGMNGPGGDDVPDDQIAKSFFMPKLCNQCDDSPCTRSCPVGATFLTPIGAVVVDYDYCIGCGYCIQTCPYGSRFWNAKKNTADKCTLCYHRIIKGKLPACVEVCPVKARIFGNLADPKSEISKFCRDNAVETLKPYLKTGAKVMYKGLTKEVV
jgi:Fe-S-cluster-containing dehydrogenase component